MVGAVIGCLCTIALLYAGAGLLDGVQLGDLVQVAQEIERVEVAMKKKKAIESKTEQSTSERLSDSLKSSDKLNQEWKIFNDLLGTFGNDQVPDSDGGTVGFTEEGQHVIHPFKLILQEAMGYQIATEGEPLIPVSEEMAAAAAGASSSGGGTGAGGAFLS